jgi:hypothetical protein
MRYVPLKFRFLQHADDDILQEQIGSENTNLKVAVWNSIYVDVATTPGRNRSDRLKIGNKAGKYTNINRDTTVGRK